MLLLLACSLAAIALAIAARAIRSRPAELFGAGWAAMALAGVLLWGFGGVFGPAVAFLGPLFPAAQLAGALALVRGRAPAWLLGALALAWLRALAPTFGAPAIGSAISLGLEPLGSLAAALVVLRLPRSHPPFAPVLGGLLVTAAGLDLASAVELSHGALSHGVPLLWLGLAAVTLPVQVQLDTMRLRERRRHAQLELAQSRERFRALTENAFDLIAELDDEERFTYVNPRYEEVLGHPAASLEGRTPASLVHRDDLPAVKRFSDDASISGRASGLVVRARHRDGHWIWIENTAGVFLAPDGTRRWVLSSRDVTGRRQSEAQHEREREELEEAVNVHSVARRASEARFRALADHAPELISEFDEQGRYTFANAAFADLLGIDPESLVGARPDRLIHPDDLAGSRDGMADALRVEGAAHSLHRLRHADGSWRWFESTGRAYRTETGDLRFVSIGRDVTEARAAADSQRRIDAHMQAVQRLESLGVLAGGVAHDFNNLLAVILGNVTLLEVESADPDALRERLRRIRAAARHGEALTEQMLTYAGKSVSHRATNLDLSDLVRDTRDLLEASVSPACALSLELAAALPPVEGDPTQLRQVLVNLVSNASEALADGAGRIRVRTGSAVFGAAALADGLGADRRPEGRWAWLEVDDDGPGIPPDRQARIFEPFQTSKESGRGLGLAAALGIARAHGGVLQLDSTPRHGTRFRLLLPIADAPHAVAPVASTRTAPMGSARVLVVDDDEPVREVAQAFLTRAGFDVLAMASGAEALARLREGLQVDAVVLDLAMPDVSGAEVLRTLRIERPQLPVVVVSGYQPELDDGPPGAASPFARLQKPYDPSLLVATLRRAVAGARDAPPRRAAPAHHR